MNHSHVKNLINLGFLVDEEIAEKVEKLDEESFYKVIDFLKKEKPFMLTKDILSKILTKDIEILKQFKPVESFTIQDFVKTMNERYNFLHDILINKVEVKNIVSINKAGNGNVSIIGLVKEMSEKNSRMLVVLEDPTGDIKTLIDKKLAEKLALDDVVAASGKISNRIMFVDKLLFPGIPLRPVNYSQESVKIAFLSSKKSNNADYVFYKDKIKDRIKKKTYEMTEPCLVKVKNVTILVIFGFDPLAVINKRYVRKGNTDFLLDKIPDILFTDKKISMNYKGVSVVSMGNVIDLKTREVEKAILK
jgi:DNA polymerase II small subunit/DNA polymerase delta subunit B